MGRLETPWHINQKSKIQAGTFGCSNAPWSAMIFGTVAIRGLNSATLGPIAASNWVAVGGVFPLVPSGTAHLSGHSEREARVVCEFNS